MLDRKTHRQALATFGVVLGVSWLLFIGIHRIHAQSVTPTPSVTQTPGSNAYPGITETPGYLLTPSSDSETGSPTAVASDVFLPEIQSSGTITSTPTLLPFPTVSLVFPSALVTATPESLVRLGEERPGDDNRVWLVPVIIILWAGLITWFWVVQQRMG